MSDEHTPGTDRAAIAVLKELKLYEQASAGCIAMLSIIIDRETAASDMLAALRDLCEADRDDLNDSTSAVWAKAIAAIAKATGETP